jgi:hypothetical protein
MAGSPVARRPVSVAAITLALLVLLTLRPLAAQEAPRDLVVAEAGVGLRGVRYQAPTDPLPSILPAVIAVVLTNPNDGFAAEGVRLRLTVAGEDDRTIRDEIVEVPQVLPRERRGLVAETTIPQDRLPVAGAAAQVEAVTRWVAVRAVPLLAVSTEAAYPQFHGDLVGGGAIALPYAAGILTNPLDAALGEVLLSGIVYDQAGRVVGGALRRVPYLAPAERRPVGSGTLIYGTDIESRTLVGAAWGRAELFAAYPWIDLAPYRR